MTDLTRLANAADALWAEYLKLGPGRLNVESLIPFDEALGAVRAAGQGTGDADADAADLVRPLLAELEALLHRCVERTEGLSFVTGEAGLIPRRDLHEKCELALAQLRQIAAAEDSGKA